MTVFEALMLAIAFCGLIISIPSFNKAVFALIVSFRSKV
ncbi:putative holin-like toxin [Bacillus sp. SM2101]|nr:putative holin-like toxin [Bacillus sp. SM2101]